jgi:hypothetical protein
MESFSQYYHFPSLEYEPDSIDLVKSGNEFHLYHGSVPFLSPAGKMLSNNSEHLVRAVLTDLQLRFSLGLKGLSYASLMAYKTDILDGGMDAILRDFSSIFDQDPFIMIKTSTKTVNSGLEPDDPLFSFSFNTLTDLIVRINHQMSLMMAEYHVEETENNPIFGLIRVGYVSLDNWSKSVIHALISLNQPGIILPMALISGKLTPIDYTNGLLALKLIKPELYEGTFRMVSLCKGFLEMTTTGTGYERTLKSVISEGEGDRIEFKSTLRWDIRAGKTNQAIERACLKSVAAFLNTRGGVLLIGIRDDGSVEGIETDKFVNEDKFLLHFWTLIRTCFGKDFSPYIRTTLEKMDGKTVCMVTCQPSERPVFLRQPGFDEELFIRVGPASNALTISEALMYFRERFPSVMIS